MYYKKGIFSKVPSELLKDFEKKTSQPPPTELILLKSKRKRKSSPSLYVSWFIICPPKKIYCTTTAFITLLHPWFYLKKRKWTRKKCFNFYSFSNTMEVTLRPVWPPNWNVGVGKTTRTLKWLEKKALNSASVQLQEVMKKSPLGLSMEATLLR